MKSIQMIKRVDILLTVLCWLFIVAFAFFISAYLFSSTGKFIGDSQKVDMPYQLSHEQVDHLIASGIPLVNSRRYTLEDGEKKYINLRNSDGSPMKSRYSINNKILLSPFSWQGMINLLCMSIYIVLMVYGLYLLKRILKNTIRYNPFVAENAVLLRRISYLVFAYVTASWLYHNVVSQLIKKSLDDSYSSSFTVGIDTETVSILLLGCLLLILASVFEYGGEIKQEVDLTI